jgi:hypothetical protein
MTQNLLITFPENMINSLKLGLLASDKISMNRLWLLPLFLGLSACKNATPDMSLLNALYSAPSSSVGSNSGYGRPVVGSDPTLSQTPSYKIRARVPLTPQQSEVTTSHFRVRGQVDL